MQIADTQLSMSLRMRLHWLYSKRKWNRPSISPQLHWGLCFLSRDGDVKCCSLFSALYDRFVRDDFLESIDFLGGLISDFN